MATSSSQQREEVPEYVLQYNEVTWKPTNHLPLLTIPESKSYFQDARNLLLSSPCKTALSLNIPANKELLFTFWATAHVLTGHTDKGVLMTTFKDSYQNLSASTLLSPAFARCWDSLANPLVLPATTPFLLTTR